MVLRSWASLFLCLYAVILPWTRAQITTAECESSFSWMNNQKGQQPCLVAAFLMSPCLEFPSESEVLGLIQGIGINAYLPPGGTNFYQATTCMCSSVTYSLLAACGLCQGFSYDSWTDWIVNCPSNLVNDGAYPNVIPSAVSVPTWAYLSVAAGNGFDIVNAESVAAKNPADVTATGTGATATGKGLTTSVPTFSFSQPTFSVSEPTFSFSEPSISIPTFSEPTGESTTTFHRKKKTNVGAIVGGIIGGISALLSAIGGIWLFIKRRARQALKPTSESAIPAAASTPDPEKLNAASPGSTQPVLPADYFPATLAANPAPTPVLYNPDDPSTFPDAQPQPAAPPGAPGPALALPPSAPSSVPSHTPPPNSTAYTPTQY